MIRLSGSRLLAVALVFAACHPRPAAPDLPAVIRTPTASGRAGLALGSDDTKHFDLALCDVILGDVSGPAVYEALRALRPSVRVLYMSGYADEAIVKTGVLEEGHPFLQKPFTPRDLAVKIRDVLDRPEGD